MGAEATVSKLSFNYHKYQLWVSNFSGSDKVFALNIKFPLKICKYSGELMPEQKFPPLLAKFTYLSNFSFLNFLWRTYNVFFISIILLILKVKILALLYEHGSENIWIRVKILHICHQLNMLPIFEALCCSSIWRCKSQEELLNIASNANVFLKQPDCKLPPPLIFKEFNIKMIPICTFFVCLLFMERENSFWAKLPLEIEIFLYCNKTFSPLWRVSLKIDKYQLKTRRCEDYFLKHLFPFN